MTAVLVSRSERPEEPAAEALALAIEAALAARTEECAVGDDAFVNVALSGGSALAAWPLAVILLGDSLAHVRLTWVDERCVPVVHVDSNRGATLRAMKDAGISTEPAEQLPLWLDGESPDEAVARVRAGLRGWGGRLDVTLLGMGPDGHIASLFPGHVWIGEHVRFVDDSPKPPATRMTLTRPLLATTRSAILLASGESKRSALTALLAGDDSLPAVGLPGLRLFTDLDLFTLSQTTPRETS